MKRADAIDAVLFDFGGVFTASPFDAIEAVGAEMGAPPGRLQEIVFGPYHEDTDHPWHRLERGEIALGDARDEIIALGRAEGLDADPFQMFARMGGSGSGDAGAREVLVDRTRRLRACGIRTGLVTNNAREFRERWMQLLPVVELFEVVVDSSEVGMRKPDPRIYHHALDALGVVADRTLFLDDAQSNVDAATRLGIRGVLVTEDLQHALASLDAILAAREGGAR